MDAITLILLVALVIAIVAVAQARGNNLAAIAAGLIAFALLIGALA